MTSPITVSVNPIHRNSLLFLLFLISILMASTNDRGVIVCSSEALEQADTRPVVPVIDQPTVTMEIDTLRALDEVNLSGSADAYPWISSDGLRLYFSQGSDTKIFTAERKNDDESFSEPVLLPLVNGENVDCFCPWLTVDEKTIFFIKRRSDNQRTTTLYRANRTMVTVPFDTCSKITLVGDITGFLSGPSLTQDLEHLFLYNSNSSDIDYILYLNKSGDNEYTLRDTLSMPAGYTPAPGQLSVDGERFYLGIESGSTRKLAVLTRYNERGVFEHHSFLEFSDSSSKDMRMMQPSVSGNGKHVVFVSNSSNSWDSNDLYVASDLESIALLSSSGTASSSVSLTQTKNNIALTLHSEAAVSTVELFSVSGKLLKAVTSKVGDSKVSVSMQEFPSGCYLYRVIPMDGYPQVGRFRFTK